MYLRNINNECTRVATSLIFIIVNRSLLLLHFVTTPAVYPPTRQKPEAVERSYNIEKT